MDAAYEAMQKRVFVVAIVLALLQAPFVIEVAILYKRLGPRTKQEDTKEKEYKYTKLESDDKDD